MGTQIRQGTAAYSDAHTALRHEVFEDDEDAHAYLRAHNNYWKASVGNAIGCASSILLFASSGILQLYGGEDIPWINNVLQTTMDVTTAGSLFFCTTTTILSEQFRKHSTNIRDAITRHERTQLTITR